jgi:hypothetical protein
VIFGPTKHGTLIGKFTDRFGAECSIQESSYQEEDCIWLGVETDSMGESLPNGRMHLTRERARELILVLRHFVETGALGVYDRSEYHLGRWVVGVGDDNNGIIGRVIEVQPRGLSVQDNEKVGEAGIWHCSWERVGDVWVPTDPPPQGRSLFDHLDD